MLKLATIFYTVSLIITAPANLLGMLMYNRRDIAKGKTKIGSVLAAIIIATIIPAMNILIAATNIVSMISGDCKDDETK